MGQYVTKKQQVLNLLQQIETMITINNVDDCLPILKWSADKFILNDAERRRQSTHKKNKNLGKPRAIKRGEIYGATLGRNIGSEQNGRSRPVIILQDTFFSQESPTVLVAPLTAVYDKCGNHKRIMKTHVLFSHPKLTKDSVIKLEHIRSISKNRLNSLICEEYDTKTLMSEIDDKLFLTFGIKRVDNT